MVPLPVFSPNRIFYIVKTPKKTSHCTVFTVFQHVSISDLAVRWLKRTGLLRTLINDMPVFAVDVTVVRVKVTVTATVRVLNSVLNFRRVTHFWLRLLETKVTWFAHAELKK